MKKKSKVYRTTISIPEDLKHRMDGVEEPVNWSGVAGRAFETELAEIAARKERKTREDVIQRLRASKQRATDAQYRDGEAAGRHWAEHNAEADELMRLARLRADLGTKWDWSFEIADRGPYSPAEWVFFAIWPDLENDRLAARDFWEEIVNIDKEVFRANEPLVVKGFAEGALAIWRDVQNYL